MQLYNTSTSETSAAAAARPKSKADRTAKNALELALKFASMGLPVFPLIPGTKKPYAGEGITAATKDPKRIRSWFAERPGMNYAVRADGLVIVDIDAKNGVDGFEELRRLGLHLPSTLIVDTANGGEHHYYMGAGWGQAPIARGVDVRAAGGYVVGPGSVVAGKPYTVAKLRKPAPVPPSLEAHLHPPGYRAEQDKELFRGELDTEAAIRRGMDYCKEFRSAEQGSRDATGYVVACNLKDIGLSQDAIAEIMAEHWNPRNEPPLDNWEIEKLARNAWASGKRRPGCCSADADFDPIPEEEIPAASGVRWPVCSGRGEPDPMDQRNVAALLDFLALTVRFNDLSKKFILGSPFDDPRDLNDAEMDRLWSVACQKGLRTAYETFSRFVRNIGREKTFHPVRDYLLSRRWDGVARVETWLPDYCGAANTPLIRAWGKLVLVAAVRRARQPGCKFDNMLVLEAKQGAGKSSVARILGGEWFSDGLQLGQTAKETIEQTTGAWIVEIAELSGLPAREVEHIKHQLSRQSDKARLAFERSTSEIARQFIMIGTTNDDRYLRDHTGNRRFLPVVVGLDAEIELERLRNDRDQLWAEAVELERNYGLELTIPRGLWAEAERVQARRVVIDPVEEHLEELLGDPELRGIIPSVQAFRAMGYETVAQAKPHHRATLKRVAERHGWNYSQLRFGNSRNAQRGYIRAGEGAGAGPVLLYDKAQQRFA